jgi:hypothetical protein
MVKTTCTQCRKEIVVDAEHLVTLCDECSNPTDEMLMISQIFDETIFGE